MFNIVKSFLSAYERRSLSECLECMAEDGVVMAYGTNAEEKRIGASALREQLEQDWAQSRSSGMEIAWRRECLHGNFGWLAADLVFRFETDSGTDRLPGRASFALARNAAGKWRIEHMHFSLPANKAAGAWA
jgi:ketosteroid isomerase-like protein